MPHSSTTSSTVPDPAGDAAPKPGTPVRAGDVLEAHGIPGTPIRRGVITEVIGSGVHQHFRVRWDEQHESLYYPGAGEGMHIVHRQPVAPHGDPTTSAAPDTGEDDQ